MSSPRNKRTNKFLFDRRTKQTIEHFYQDLTSLSTNIGVLQSNIQNLKNQIDALYARCPRHSTAALHNREMDVARRATEGPEEAVDSPDLNVPAGPDVTSGEVPNVSPQAATEDAADVPALAVKRPSQLERPDVKRRKAEGCQSNSGSQRASTSSAPKEIPLLEQSEADVSTQEGAVTPQPVHSQNDIRRRWGREGMMVEIMRLVRLGDGRPITLSTLVGRGPQLPSQLGDGRPITLSTLVGRGPQLPSQLGDGRPITLSTLVGRGPQLPSQLGDGRPITLSTLVGRGPQLPSQLGGGRPITLSTLVGRGPQLPSQLGDGRPITLSTLVGRGPQLPSQLGDGRPITLSTLVDRGPQLPSQLGDGRPITLSTLVGRGPQLPSQLGDGRPITLSTLVGRGPQLPSQLGDGRPITLSTLVGRGPQLPSQLGDGRPITLSTLVGRGPQLPSERITIAMQYCTSLLMLNNRGFIRLVEDPETGDIVNITLGPIFDNH